MEFIKTKRRGDTLSWIFKGNNRTMIINTIHNSGATLDDVTTYLNQII